MPGARLPALLPFWRVEKAECRMVQQEGLSSVSFRLTAPSAEEARQGVASAERDQRTKPVWRLCNRPLKTFARSPLRLMAAQRWQVAAALSAAVTTTNQQETAPNLAGGTQARRKRPTPNATRSSGEGGWGRGASLREAASPPASPPPVISSGGSAREGASLSEKHPPSQNTYDYL